MHNCEDAASVPNTDVMRDAQRLSRFGVSGNRSGRRWRSCLDENSGSTASFTARNGRATVGCILCVKNARFIATFRFFYQDILRIRLVRSHRAVKAGRLSNHSEGLTYLKLSNSGLIFC